MITNVFLVTGSSSLARETAIAALIKPGDSVAVLAEGLPDGIDLFAAHAGPAFHLARIAPACLCCTGMLTTRITLNRLLRYKPERLFLGLASDMHIDAVESVFSQPPYDALLRMVARVDADKP